MAALTPISTPVVPAVLAEWAPRTSRRLDGGAGPTSRRGLLPALDLCGVVAVMAVHAWGAGQLPLLTWVLPAVWLVLLAGADAFAPGRAGTSARTVLRAGARLGLGCAVLSVVAPAADLGPMLVLTAAVTAASAGHRLLVAACWPGRPVPAVVAGESVEVARLLTELRRAKDRRWRAVAVCLPESEAGAGFDLPVTAGFDQLTAAVVGSEARAVVVAPGGRLDPAVLRRAAWMLETAGIDLYVGTGLLDVSWSRARLVRAGGLRLLHLRPAPSGGPSRWAKELVERTAAAAALVLLLPLLVAIALAVRRDSAGPAVFRQVRVGRGGRGFTMLKFRTMTDGADAALTGLVERNECVDGVLFKIRHDPRVTRLGGKLRRYSLDELPQLVNVVRGEMALVGPRPALPSEVSAYDRDPTRRLAVKPGLTGLWQVSGRSDLSWDETVRLDLAYVDNWSLGLDLAILGRTVGAVLGHRGAY